MGMTRSPATATARAKTKVKVGGFVTDGTTQPPNSCLLQTPVSSGTQYMHDHLC